MKHVPMTQNYLKNLSDEQLSKPLSTRLLGTTSTECLVEHWVALQVSIKSMPMR